MFPPLNRNVVGVHLLVSGSTTKGTSLMVRDFVPPPLLSSLYDPSHRSGQIHTSSMLLTTLNRMGTLASPIETSRSVVPRISSRVPFGIFVKPLAGLIKQPLSFATRSGIMCAVQPVSQTHSISPVGVGSSRS